MKVPHSRPTITDEDINAVVSNLQSGQIASGSEVNLFEKELSRYIGVNSGVATNSGTNALYLALKAIGSGPGDEVLLPTYVCASVLSAVNYTGAKPILADIDEGYNIAPESAGKKISDKTKAVIVPHMFGSPADIDGIMELGIPVIEDCAQSIGAEYKGKKLGSFGDLSIFSFFATKMMATGHGGMVLSDSPKLLERLEDLTTYDEREKYGVAYNFELTDFQAALGRSQLNRLDSFIDKRKEIAKVYDDTFNRVGEPGRKRSDGVCFRYVVEVDNPDRYINAMRECGVSCAKPVFRPLHRYLDSIKSKEFPNAEHAMNRAISIPIYPSLNDDELECVCESIEVVWAGGASHPVKKMR